MKYADAFPSQWLTADDVDGDMVVTISSDSPVEYREFKAPGKATPDSKPVLYFKGPKGTKPLILNKTNWKTIGQVLGSDDTDDWAGQSITLYATEVDSFGEKMMGIRVRLQKSRLVKPAPNVTKSVPRPQPQPEDFYEAQTSDDYSPADDSPVNF
jgi:hypothetical protein